MSASEQIPVEPLTRAIAALRDKGHTLAAIAAHSGGLDRCYVRRLLNGEPTWVRPATAAAIAKAWQELKDKPPRRLSTVAERWQALDAADHSGRSAAQVADLTGLSPRSVKRRRSARRSADTCGGQVAA